MALDYDAIRTLTTKVGNFGADFDSSRIQDENIDTGVEYILSPVRDDGGSKPYLSYGLYLILVEGALDTLLQKAIAYATRAEMVTALWEQEEARVKSRSEGRIETGAAFWSVPTEELMQLQDVWYKKAERALAIFLDNRVEADPEAEDAADDPLGTVFSISHPDEED